MKKIAVISTVWFPLSHTDVMVTRWVKPFFTDAAHGWHRPDSVIASVFLDQTPTNDIGRGFCRANGIPVAESVAGALTLGTDELAVDAVLLIGEHGEYPVNEFRQRLYPRKRLFDEIVAVFRQSGRAVPVFNDKHFSWDFGHSCEMLRTADELGFPLYGGSSLTHCPLVPLAPLACGAAVSEVLALFHGDPDNYGFHSMEFVQSLIEHRSGGETGIRAVRSFDGRGVIDAVSSGQIPSGLLLRALVHHGYPDDPAVVPFVLERVQGLLAYQLAHRDGLVVTHVCLPKFASEWVAVFRSPKGIASCHLAGGGGGRDFFSNFARLNARVEEFFQTGRPPTPVLRTHLVTGALQSALQALAQPGCWIDTPDLAVCYGDTEAAGDGVPRENLSS